MTPKVKLDFAALPASSIPPILFEITDTSMGFMDIVDGWGFRDYGLGFYYSNEIEQHVITHLKSGAKIHTFKKFQDAQTGLLRLLALNVDWTRAHDDLSTMPKEEKRPILSMLDAFDAEIARRRV